MRIISRKAFRDYWEEHSESAEVLNDFNRKLIHADAGTIVQLRKTFPSADLVGDCVVFNVGGNNYRVIAHIAFDLQIVWVRFVLSHADYDKGKWKADC